MTSDLTHYAILCAHQETAGYFAERSLEDSCSRAATIDDIINGNLTRVMKVFAFNPVEGWSRDVTEDIAIKVANLLDASDMIPDALLDFIEANASTEYTRGLRVVDKSFSAGE
jgi:hypothetical protein